MSSSATPGMPANSAAEVCQTMKKELLEKLEILSQDLPPNTLDELIDDLGGPDYVAEVRIKTYRTCLFSVCTHSTE